MIETLISPYYLNMKRIYCFVFLSFIGLLSYAQWHPTNGPSNEKITCFASIWTMLFAGTEEDGVYCSANNGESWFSENTGLTHKHIK